MAMTDGTSGISHFLIAGEQKRKAMAVVRECVLFWENLVAQGRFAEPTS
jgi:hypothetical protein